MLSLKSLFVMICDKTKTYFPPDCLGAAKPRAWCVVLFMAFNVKPMSAMSALASILRGKRVRGWNQLCALANTHPKVYQNWIRHAEPHIIADYCRNSGSAVRPISAVILAPDRADLQAVDATCVSLREAFGEKSISIWTNVFGLSDCQYVSEGAVDVLDQIGAQKAVSGVDVGWLLPLRAGDRISSDLPRALGCMNIAEDTSVIFWDEDRLEGVERRSPIVKPDWDEILFRSYDGLTGACLIDLRKAAIVAKKLTPPLNIIENISAVVAELALQSSAPKPVHIPLILSHRIKSDISSSKSASLKQQSISRRTAVSDVIQPPVSIIIPTRDRVNLLRCCLTSLDFLPAAAQAEIIIVDNGSVEPETLHFFTQLENRGKAQVIKQPGPFNFSALVNAGVAASKNEFICLLNNDTEALDGRWLALMMDYATRPEVGAVGARLLYPDGTIQHAGVAIGIGGAAGHVDKGALSQPDLVNLWHDVDREVSAVTAACLLVQRSKYLAVGGMDETHFAVDFNDVDLCLRLIEHGWRSVYCAEATLVHHESVSRGNQRRGAALERFNGELLGLKQRWKTETVLDPHHSHLFRRAAEQCQLRF